MKLVKSSGGLPVRPDTDPFHRLAVGPVSFTCTSCGDSGTAHFSNMVFRSLEFYCLSCGSPFRISNPAFSNVKPKK